MRGVTPTGTKRKPKRLLTWSATRVADLIHRRGPVLRAALGLPPAAAALPSAPSMIEENAALSAAIKQKSAAYTALERELAICRAERADFADKLHKAKKRAERKRADARKYLEAQQRGYSEAQKAARAAQLATRKRNFDAAVERASYVRVVTLTRKLERANKRLEDAGLAHAAALDVKKTEVARARKRARAVEGDAAKLPGLQLQVKELKARVEELRVEEESESEDDEPSPRPGCSPIVGLLPRRDEHGRWQAEIIEAMAAAANASVKATLDDELDEFSSFERIDADGSCVIRAAFKQFHHGGEYAKGRGREFESWRKTRALMFLPFERAAGSRQDLAFDGCVPLFVNRVTCVDFLRGYIDYPKSQNVLDKSLYTVMKCNEFTALLRVNTLWRFAFSDPLRWLCGSASKLDDWSLYKLSLIHI